MSEYRIYLKKQDLIKMLNVIDKFPEYKDKNFILNYSSCELGSTVDMILETSVNGVDGELVIPIVDVSEW
jgi:hypothetical protein